MTRRSILVIVAGTSLLLTAVPLVRVMADQPRWKGAQSMALLSLAQNQERCGSSQILEARFAGDGLDSRGGVFTVTASGCVDPISLYLHDLEATDRFSPSDSLSIQPADAQLILDPDTCIATNREPVPFGVGGGTGRFEGADGQGTYDIALSWPLCSGTALPARVWFEGTLLGVDG